MYFVVMGEWNPPCNPLEDIQTSGKTFQIFKGKHVVKRAESHRCEVNTLGILACNFSTFSRFLKGFSLENSLQNLNGVTDLSQKMSKN